MLDRRSQHLGADYCEALVGIHQVEDGLFSPLGLQADFSLEDIICHESLGGLLKYYERRAA